jgi:hypothetical protein
MAFLNGEQLSELAKSGETPITFFSDEAVVCIWKRSKHPVKLDAFKMTGVRTADSVYSRVVRIRDHQGKLGTCVPTLRCSFRISIIKVDRDRVVGRSIRITKRKE